MGTAGLIIFGAVAMVGVLVMMAIVFAIFMHYAQKNPETIWAFILGLFAVEIWHGFQSLGVAATGLVYASIGAIALLCLFPRVRQLFVTAYDKIRVKLGRSPPWQY